MTRRADAPPHSRAGYRAARGVLLVTRDAPLTVQAAGQPMAVPANPAEGSELLIAVWDDGSVNALHGHVDLGTGLATAIAQIAADELDVKLAEVRAVLGHTASAPNQGLTIASASIQVYAVPLRAAAALARSWLIERAAQVLGLPADALEVTAGVVHQRGHAGHDGGVAGAGSSDGDGEDAGVAEGGRTGGIGATSSPHRRNLGPADTSAPDDAASPRVSYAELLRDAQIELKLPADVSTVRVKTPAEHRIVGRSAPRVDIPAKATGGAVFVHDVRLPGMLHGRVVRPPYAGVDAGAFVGHTLEAVDESSIAHIPGIRAVVVIGDFVGIVAEREEHAEAAMRALQVRWKSWPGMRALGDLEQALRTNPATRRVLLERGDVAAANRTAAQPMPRTYVWPYQLHASIGPSCAVAQWHGLAPAGASSDSTPGSAAPADASAGATEASASGAWAGAGAAGRAQAHVSQPALTVWAGTQNPHVLRADLARLVGVADIAVDVIRMEASGCYGRNSADDVAADAALLARATGAPVRVQLSREQEHLWEPKGAAQLMQIDGGLSADGTVAAYDFQTSYPSNGAPTLALLLTGTVAPDATAYEMGDRTAVPPYAYENLRVAANDMAPILRASWLRGVSALPNTFAHESYVDELASAAGADPVEFRLRHLPDARAAELVRATAARAGWMAHTRPQQQPSSGDVLKGQGFAYARYVHSKFPGYGAAWSAWVADVEVNRVSGEVHVSRVVVGHDAGLMINPDGVRHQVQGNVLQTTSRALNERVRTDADTSLPAAREWGAYPILSFREVPVVEVMTMPRPGEPPLGVGESSSVPGTAAIANAIFDATGVRFRAPPFTPEVVRAALNPNAQAAQDGAGASGSPDAAANSAAAASAQARQAAQPPLPRSRRLAAGARWPRRRSLWARGVALAAGLIGVGAALLGWRPAIAPVAVNSANVYSLEAIERGRQLAALGACAVCHTAPGGVTNAGGRALATPFGDVYSTNLTPDAATGIGAWSFSAFQRAMREGVSRDGHHLYPAFPYTSFTHASDDDLNALYAYLMAQPAVSQAVSETRLAFPFNLRPLMALWNALYLEPGTAQPGTPPAPVSVAGATTALWARGAYLVNGMGHCGACHTPRDAFGAEKLGTAYLGGAMVDGWEAPPLTALSHAPLPWTEDALFRYLRFGFDPAHGSASGPMAPVVRELAQVDDADLRAMAHYLASFNAPQQAENGGRASERPDGDAQAVGEHGGNAAHAVPQLVQALRQDAMRREATLPPGAAQRLFNGACGACHHAGDGPQLLGLNLPLALNTQLHSTRPDNVIRVILEGIREPASAEIGFMPAYRDALDDAQVAQLVAYMRQRFAPGQPAWPDLEAASARIRAAPSAP